MTTIIIIVTLGILIGLARYIFTPTKVFFPLEKHEYPSRIEHMEMLRYLLIKKAAEQPDNITLEWKTSPTNDELVKYLNEIIQDDKVEIIIKDIIK